MPDFVRDSEFWVLIAFIIAIAFLIYKARGVVTKALDARAAKIKAELDEAQRLREEAQAKLAEYQRKQRDALKEADAIVARKYFGHGLAMAGKARRHRSRYIERRASQRIPLD